MTRGRAHLVGWSLIAATVALSFAIDHYRLLHSHFNWFMLILVLLSAGLVAVVARLSRSMDRRQKQGDEDNASAEESRRSSTVRRGGSVQFNRSQE